MGLLTTHVEAEELIPGLIQHIIHPRRVAYQEAGYLRPMFTDWEDSGDGNHPHMVANAPMMIRASNTGIMRWHPTRDTQVWMEIGDPVFRPAGGGPVQTFDFANPTRNGNRIRWNKNAADLIYDHGGHFGKFGLVLKTAARPLNREFAFPLTYQGLVRNGRVLSYQGQDVMHMRPFDAYDLDDPDGERINVPHEFRNVQGQEFVVLTLPIEIDSFARPVLDPTLVLQPDAADGLDTTVVSNNPTTNNGTQAWVRVGMFSNNVQRTLIKFDLTTLPDGAVLSAATLSLNLYDDDAIQGDTIRVYRQQRAWVETEATWNIYSTGNSWSTAGGFHADDCEQTDIGSIVLTDAEAGGFKDISLTPVSKAALDLGNGWLIKGDTETNDRYGYRSSDWTTPAERPVFTVAYTVPAAAPSNLAAVLCS